MANGIMNPQQMRPNPNFPNFFSMQNLRNFGSDVLKGGALGGLGGAIGGIGRAGVTSWQTAQQTAREAGTAGPSVMEWASQAIPQGARETQSQFSNIYNRLGGAQGLQRGAAAAGQALGAIQQFMSPQQAAAQNAQEVGTVPQASSGPIMAGGGSGGGPGGYFSFDKYFGGQGTNRGAIAEGAGGPGVTNNAGNQPQLEPGPGAQQTIGQQEEVPMEEWGAPESGIGKYAYNVFDWLNKSKAVQTGVGALAGGLTNLAGPLGFLAAPAVGFGASAGLRGLSGQLRNFFAVRQNQQAQGAPA